MQGRTRIWIILWLIAAMALPPLAMAEVKDIAGEWVCAAVDTGDGVKLTEYEGANVADLMRIEFKADGTLTFVSQGAQSDGTWAEADGGLSAAIDGQDVLFELTGGQLVNDTDGFLIYLEKAKPKKKGGLLGALNIGKYTGKWVATGFDSGDGVIQPQVDGVDAAVWMTLQIKRDGTLVLTSSGEDMPGTWKEIEGGISITIDDQTIEAILQDGKLVLSEDGEIVYLEREGQGSVGTTPAPTAMPVETPMPTTEASSGFIGAWSAVRYETGEYWYDAKTLFPDGCEIALNEDGTGSAKITKDYTEALTWSEVDGVPVLQGSNIFADPKWDADSGELRFRYGTGDVFVVFVMGEVPESSGSAEYGLIGEATAEPSAEPEATPPAEEPAATEAPEPEESTSEQAFTSPLFNVSFPGDWVSNEYSLSTDESYCSVKYEKKDGEGSSLASVSINAVSEGVDNYRSALKRLTEYAEKAGKTALDEVTIGGISFRGIAYENWGWNYREYAARVPESSITLSVVVEQPENAEDAIPAILDSIAFTLPELTPPNVDPPLPEDGVPFEPTPGSAKAGKFTLKADWVVLGKSIVLDSILNNQIALAGKRLYALTGKKLGAYSIKGNKLSPDDVFEGGVMTLSDSFESLSAVKDGTLYASQGMFNILAIKDGKVLADNSLSGDLVMHPGGKWGISFWANADTAKVAVKDGVLTGEPWILTNLSDPEKRTGRFDMISCVAISDKRIYVAGSDATNGDAQRIAVYDLNGKELFDFGGLDWMQDDALGSVTGIVETKNGILVQDGNNHAFKLFAKDGTFIASVACDELLGTNYPWLSSMIPSDDGVLVAASQKRNDQSCDELLMFRITGF